MKDMCLECRKDFNPLKGGYSSQYLALCPTCAKKYFQRIGK